MNCSWRGHRDLLLWEELIYPASITLEREEQRTKNKQKQKQKHQPCKNKNKNTSPAKRKFKIIDSKMEIGKTRRKQREREIACVDCWWSLSVWRNESFVCRELEREREREREFDWEIVGVWMGFFIRILLSQLWFSCCQSGIFKILDSDGSNGYIILNSRWNLVGRK